MTKLPYAIPVHKMAHRVRLRVEGDIPGDISGRLQFFNQIEMLIGEAIENISVCTNPGTGSVLLEGQGIDLEKIGGAAAKAGLFTLVEQRPRPAKRVIVHSRKLVAGIDKAIRKLTTDQLDMSSSVFLILVVHALREVAKGNLRTPSWFTALWFASTLFTRDFSTGPAGSGCGHDGSGAEADG